MLDISEPRTHFACISVLNILIPVVMFRFLGRHSQGYALNNLLADTIPVLPFERKLCFNHGHKRGKLQFDEFLETHSVRTTKSGSRIGNNSSVMP